MAGRGGTVMTDSASHSNQVFGLFRLLGYQFSPRLADVGDTCFWRLDRHASYGPFDQVARHRINLRRYRSRWARDPNISRVGAR